MANHRFQDSIHNLEKFPVKLWAHAVSANWATTAPTVDADKSLGIQSIVRTAVGKYTITLKAKYNSVLGVSVSFISAASGIVSVDIEEDDVDGATPVVKLVFMSDASTDADPAANAVALIGLELRNSAAG